jgi:predicted Holliday junction resolvase-like endonuclease
MRFLGSPVDYVSFCYETDTITFVEVKTGGAVLNDNQRKVKKMVENGRVKFVTVRLDENGVKVK